MRLPTWLVPESEAWQREGLITEDQRRAILARYAAPPSASQQASSTIMWLAVLVAGIGATVLVAWNWTSIPTIVKVLLSAGPMLGCYAWAAWASLAGRDVSAKRLALLAALFSGGVLFVTEDLQHLDPQQTSAPLLWAAIVAVTALLTPSALIAAVGTAVLGWWVLTAGENPRALWWMLAVWPVLAVTLEREFNRWVAGGLTLLFGFWTFVVVLSVWPDQPATAAIGVVLAGTWFDTLARAPVERHPAFARATPAFAITLLGLTVLMVSAVHRTTNGWQAAIGPLWPCLALLAGLACSALWQAWRTDTWRSRPVVLTALAGLWLAFWIALPGPLRMNGYVHWAWTLAFSAAAILMGAGAVREAARTRDPGQFILGLSSVLVFVIVRVSDARSLIASGLMLLGSALMLWWLGRLWARPATPGGTS